MVVANITGCACLCFEMQIVLKTLAIQHASAVVGVVTVTGTFRICRR